MDQVENPQEPPLRLRSNQAAQGVRLRWRVRRTSHAFRCYVVEPAVYDPPSHAALFGRLVSAIAAPTITGLEPGDDELPITPLDIITFPEAFLSTDALVEALEFLGGQRIQGCVHVGLRPDEGEDHLFTVPAVEALLDQLRKNPRVEQEDLTVFQAWLNSMPRRNMYNIACLFMLDEDGQVRICLHPKNVASNLEVSILPNHNVSEAEFVAVVTLESVDPAFQEVNIQPLICSDALDLRTSRPGPNPIATISLEPGRVIPNAPDHIDIVSIATCTPQRDEERENLPGNESLAWQPKFRTTFVAASINAHYIRHAFATFIMSNFRIGPGNVPGGLSGGFIPARPPNERESVEGVRTWVWGKEGPRDHSWRLLDGAKVEDWKSDGQLATLHPDRPDEPEIARVFGLTIPLMLRNQNRFAPAMGLTDFVVIPIPAVASIDATIPLEAPDV